MKKRLIIAHFNHHEALKNLCMDAVLSDVGTLILDFNMACLPKTHDMNALDIALFEALQSKTLPILQKSLAFPKQIRDILNMAHTMNLYQIHPQDLPQKTPLDQEKQEILSVACALLPKPSLPKGFETIEYVAANLTQAQINFLKQHHIEAFQYDTLKTTTTTIRYALNHRIECEGALIENTTKDPYYVFPDSESMDLFSTLYAYTHDTPAVIHQQQGLDAFIALMRYLKHSKPYALYESIHASAFDIKAPIALVQALKRHDDAIAFTKQHATDTLLTDVTTLEATLETIENQNTLQDRMHVIFNMLLERQMPGLKPVQHFLEQSLNRYDDTTIDFLIEHLSQLAIQKSAPYYYTLDTFPLQGAPEAIFFNMSANRYPNIKPATGLFDDLYLNQIPGFPSQSERTHFQMLQKQRALEITEHRILSYAQTTFEGKSLEPAFLIQSLEETHTPWPSYQNKVQPTQENMTPSKAQALFLKNKKLFTSVSKIQYYPEDPLNFFIESGLGIRKKRVKQLDAATLGTLNHAYLEHDGVFDMALALKEQHVPLSKENNLILKRNSHRMGLNLEQLRAAKADTATTTITQECVVTGAIGPMHFQGFIDRVDQGAQGVYLIDYKSSAHTISPSGILKGQSLQLPIYAILYPDHVSGVFYYNLGFSLTHAPTYKIGLSGITPLEAPTKRQPKQYEGWLFNEPGDDFHSTLWVKGLKESKDSGMIEAREVKDINLLSQSITLVLGQIYDHITRGIFNKYQIEIQDPNDYKRFKKEVH